MGMKKQPKQQVNPPASVKKPHSKVTTGSGHLKPVWKFSIFDDDGPWGRPALSEDHAWNEILPKLRSFESMTWSQIEQAEKQNHSVPIEGLIRQAQKRLADLRLDDNDELFRFRLSGKQRLWGIREHNYFKILWWDADHAICPSTPKNT